MIKRILIIALLLQCKICFGQNLSKAEYLEDLQYLQDSLPKKHINLFAKISPADFGKQIAAIRTRLEKPDAESFLVELFKLPVAIGDEHTHIEPLFSKVLPIQFQKFNEGYFVTAVDSAHVNLQLYHLVGINGHPINEVIANFRTIIQSTNASFFDTRFLTYLNNPVIMKGLGLATGTDYITFNFKTHDGRIVNQEFKSEKGKSADELPLIKYKSGPHIYEDKENYWYRYDDKRKTLYFNYSNCEDEPSRPFSVFNDQLFKLIAEKKPHRLVIDLRENSGGNSGVLTPFIDSVKKSGLNVSGKFFVLIGKATFSSALMNAVTLKRETNAVLIGEATSGTVNHYGEVRGFRLPNSKIVIGYSTRYWETWKGYDGPLMPDIQIRYSVKNYARGIDEAIGYVNGLQ